LPARMRVWRPSVARWLVWRLAWRCLCVSVSVNVACLSLQHHCGMSALARRPLSHPAGHSHCEPARCVRTAKTGAQRADSAGVEERESVRAVVVVVVVVVWSFAYDECHLDPRGGGGGGGGDGVVDPGRRLFQNGWQCCQQSVACLQLPCGVSLCHAQTPKGGSRSGLAGTAEARTGICPEVVPRVLRVGPRTGVLRDDRLCFDGWCRRGPIHGGMGAYHRPSPTANSTPPELRRAVSGAVSEGASSFKFQWCRVPECQSEIRKLKWNF
jgi:hypothetical protein